MNRRNFLASGLTAAVATQLRTPAQTATGTTPPNRPVLMRVGHQHDDTEATLRTLAALGVTSICGGHRSADPQEWTVEALGALKERVEGHGIKLECLPLPMSSSAIDRAELPALLASEGSDRDQALARLAEMIRNAGQVGIPMLKYNLTFLGVVRTGRVAGRGGASVSAFDYAHADAERPLSVGAIPADTYWRRIEYFLRHVVPVAEEAKVRLALHPQDPGLPPDRPFRGVVPVLANVDGLKRFVETVPSPWHGLNFCQGTVSEMLARPGEEIFDVIRWFGTRRKIFNVHFRNIRGHVGDFAEALPDEGDVDMWRALQVYQEAGYDGMVMPDHVPQIAGDAGGQKAFAYCFGYIQALLQVLANGTPVRRS